MSSIYQNIFAAPASAVCFSNPLKGHGSKPAHQSNKKNGNITAAQLSDLESGEISIPRAAMHRQLKPLKGCLAKRASGKKVKKTVKHAGAYCVISGLGYKPHGRDREEWKSMTSAQRQKVRHQMKVAQLFGLMDDWGYANVHPDPEPVIEDCPMFGVSETEDLAAKQALEYTLALEHRQEIARINKEKLEQQGQANKKFRASLGWMRRNRPDLLKKQRVLSTQM